MLIVAEIIDYNWFYSTLSQCLAALIGMIGLLAVYRLQIQESLITETRLILIRYLSVLRRLNVHEQHNLDWYSYADDSELIALANKEIENHSKDVEVKKNLEVSTMRVKTFTKKRDNLISSKRERERFKPIAKNLIVLYILIFLFSLFCLGSANLFSKNIIWGSRFLMATVMLIIPCAWLLMDFCFNCFNMVKEEGYQGPLP